MKQVFFQNNGVIDEISITTFGINAKSTDTAIGYFGTGLKYAIAVLLRENHQIKILAGNTEYDFTTNSHETRGKAFDVVMVNNKPAGFTTELGKNWEIWQAFREIYCNTIDENGEVSDSNLVHDETKTTVIVTGDQFYQQYIDKDSIIISGEPSIKTSSCDIFKRSNKFIYFKGVRIYEPNRETIFTYNIHSRIDITEDRTAKYEFQLHRRIGSAIISCENEQIIKAAILCGDSCFESRIEYDEVIIDPSETFLTIAEKHRLNPRLNKTILKVLNNLGRLPPPSEVKLNNIQKQQLDKAISFCKQIGFNVDKYPIVVSEELKDSLHGLAYKGKVYLSISCFGYGTKYVASTLIEEFLHLDTGYTDCTRELQNLLFNYLVSFGEQITGEPV